MIYIFGKGSQQLLLETPEIPDKQKYHPLNEWYLMKAKMPRDGKPYEAQSDGTWLDVTPVDVLTEREKEKQLALIHEIFEMDANAPVEVNGVFYNGGESSASAISGAVALAQALGETDVLIAGYDNVARRMSFEDALYVAAMIGKAWRSAYFVKQASKVALGV